MIKTIVTKKVGGKAYPKDFNWICPICGSENRAFQLPKVDVLTEEDIVNACQVCSHNSRQQNINL